MHDLAGDDYRSPVLESIKEWIQVTLWMFLFLVFYISFIEGITCKLRAR